MSTLVRLVSASRKINEHGFSHLAKSLGSDFIRLTPQMLNWPIIQYRGGKSYEIKAPLQVAYRGFLGALLEFAPFSATFSLEVNRQEKFLRQADRDWARIYHDDVSVALFAYSSGEKGWDVDRCWHWPTNTDSAVWSDSARRWDSARWRIFLTETIRNQMAHKKRTAEQLMQPYQDDVVRSDEVMSALPA